MTVRAGTTNRPRRAILFALGLAALYLPYGWLLFIEELWPWNAPQWDWSKLLLEPWTWSPYHWHWMKLWPILPGWIPALWFNTMGIGRLTDRVEYVIGGFVTALVLVLVCWLALRARRWRVVLAATFVLSCLCSWQAYALYSF